MQPLQAIGIIPARYASTRFPGKPLANIAGKPMIQRVYEQAIQSNLDDVLVATDDKRIYEAVHAFGGKAIMTGAHDNGTARCMAAFFEHAMRYDILINIQGDEPFISPQQINDLLLAFELPNTPIATLIKPIQHVEELHNPNVVKVVFTKEIKKGIRNALYFSRSVIPHVRSQAIEQALAERQFYKHVGLYGFSRSFITQQYTFMQEGRLEQLEVLEQLAWLEEHKTIRLIETQIEAPSIDTPEDLEAALLWWERQPV
jgi:3-deoxy-manno-octulosonate cytidylyltransferase (CMP-KDO synthetase)